MPDLAAAASTSPAHIFISYSRVNKAFVTRLIADLQARGVPVWIDREELRAGTPNWEQALRDAIQSARAVLLIASPDSRKSSYVSDELSIAGMYKRPVYPVWAAGDQWPDSIRMGYGSVQFIDARGDQYAAALDQIVNAFSDSGSDSLPIASAAPSPLPGNPLPTAAPDSIPRNPYKGLNAFTSADQGDFFGRETLIDELTSAVEEMSKTRFLAVVGPSGSGKSSVVMAGLLPRLQAMHPDWLFLPPVLPGLSPIRALGVTLAKALPAKSNTAIFDDLNNPSAQGLDWLARTAIKQPKARVVLLVDQFEEVFTQTSDENERRQFIDLLTTASSEPDGPLMLIVTLRADFYDRPINYPALGKLFESYTKTIPPLSLSDVRDAIEKPAAQPDVALTFDDGLVAELVFDVREQIGAMPLLQFTLDQLFQRRDGHRLTMAAYRELGGVRGALTKHAEQTFHALPSDDHRQMARALFLRLIEPGDTAQDTTRRRAALAELELPDPAANTIMADCREAFVVARLLTTAQSGDTITIEVSHEALIREWPRLGEWLTNARSDVRLQKTISQDAAAWLQRGRKSDDDGLYRGLVLEDAESWAARGVPNSDEAAFVAASLAAQNKRVAEDRVMQRRLKTLRQDRIGLTIIASVTVALVIIAGYLLVLAFQSISGYRTDLVNQQYEATQIGAQVINANATLTPIPLTLAVVATQIKTGSNVIESQRLAALANDVLSSPDGDANAAVLLGIRALKTSYTAQADAVLVKALDATRAKLTFTGHTNIVYSVAYSLDGRYALTGSCGQTDVHNNYICTQGEARLWNVSNGQTVRVFSGHTSEVLSVALSADGRYALTGSYDDTARLWDVSTGQTIRIFNNHMVAVNSAVRSVAFSPDGRYALTGSTDDMARLWDVSSGQLVHTFSGHTNSVQSAAFSPDGRYALTGSDDNTARLWEVSNGQTIRILSGHTGGVTSVAFSPDGKLALTGGVDNTARLWDVSTGQTIRTFTGHTSDVNSVAFSPDGRYILTGSYDKAARLWDANTAQTIRIFTGHASSVNSVAFSPDGRYALTGSDDKTARLWDVSIGQFVRNFSNLPGSSSSVDFSPDGRYALTGSDDTTAELWDVSIGQIVRVFCCHFFYVSSVAFSPDGRYALTGADYPDTTARLWDVDTGQTIRTFSGHMNSVESVAFSPDGRYALTGSADHSARLWDVGTGQTIRIFSGHTDWVNSVAFSPDGRYVLTGSADTTARLWEVSSGQTVRIFSGHTAAVNSVTFSPDGRYALTGSADTTARLWEVSSGQTVRAFSGHTAAVNSVRFSPDDRYVLTGSDDTTARLWNVSTAQTIRILSGHTAAVKSVAFSPDGRYALTGSDDAARLWDTDYRNFTTYVCLQLSRDFTIAERLQFSLADNVPTCPQFPPLDLTHTATSAPTATPVTVTWTPVPTRTVPAAVIIPTDIPSLTPTAGPSLTPSETMTPLPTDTAIPPTITVTLQLTPITLSQSWTPIASPTSMDMPTPDRTSTK